jgi:serine/threonine protein kinase
MTTNSPEIQYLPTPTPSPSLSARLAEFGLELVREAVGSGGSAVVHQAKVRDAVGRLPAVGVLVAVKQYKRELLAQEGQLKRVQQEADLGESFDSPNVVKTYGLLPSKDQPEFLVMEWISGGTLEEWNKNESHVNWDSLRSVALGLVSGLEAIHQRSVLHRDLKPENVMVRQDGTAVIMDIGVAELTVDSAETLHTNVGQFLGSMRYASPQFLLGDPLRQDSCHPV